MQTVDVARLGLKPGDRLLDVGCGEGRHCLGAYLHENIDVVGVDLRFEDLKTARARFEPYRRPAGERRSFALSRADALSLPFARDAFDVVICSEVLEHIPDYTAALDEIRRVLKPGGMFAASVPSFGPEWLCWRLSRAYHDVAGGHVRIFRARELRRAVEVRGMTRVRRHRAHALHSPYWWLKCLFWNRKTEPAVVRLYHRFLVWDLMQKPAVTRWLEKMLNPVLGKSVVLYFVKGT